MKSLIDHIAEAEAEENNYEANKKFVLDFYATGFPHPFGNGVVFTIINDDEEQGMVMVVMSPKTWGVYLQEIHVLEGKGGMGFGAYVLSLITAMADKQSITLVLTAKPLDTQGKNIPKAKLVKFYKNNGFANRRGGGEMIRKPQGQQ